MQSAKEMFNMSKERNWRMSIRNTEMQELIDSLSLCEMIQMIKGEGYAAIRFAIKQLTKEVESIDTHTKS